eukprot:scaffold260638_cov15-Tisochrysis_lutea.AAC.1
MCSIGNAGAATKSDEVAHWFNAFKVIITRHVLSDNVIFKLPRGASVSFHPVADINEHDGMAKQIKGDKPQEIQAFSKRPSLWTLQQSFSLLDTDFKCRP